MNNIILKNRRSSKITTDAYKFVVDGQNVTYIEHINDKNELIDFNLRNEDGQEIEDDAVLLEKIQDYVDNLLATK